MLAVGVIVAVLYVIGLVAGDDRGKDISTDVKGTVQTASTLATTTTVAPPTAVTAVGETAKLPVALSRSAATSDGTTALVIGGRNTKGASVNQLLRYDPVTGEFAALANLPELLQGAAAATVANRPLIIGGGDAKPTANVSAVVDGKVSIVGHLPEPRTDVLAAVIDKTVFVVGGYDGAKEPLTVLASNDNGATFHQIGLLLQGNRHGTLVAVGQFLYLIGGEEKGVATGRIQRIDPIDGAITQLGQLPAPISGAAAFALDGSIFVAGGRRGNDVTDQILRVDLATGVATSAGTLPEPFANASVAVVGDAAYVFGGEAVSARTGVVAIRASR